MSVVGSLLAEASVWQAMLWASNRHATLRVCFVARGLYSTYNSDTKAWDRVLKQSMGQLFMSGKHPVFGDAVSTQASTQSRTSLALVVD